jgi:phospholipid/cholesterol/gamma-HCH transport system substrate-binding protein
LSKLLMDEHMGNKLDASMSNLESGTKGFSENMEAAKHNFLLKGYFNKKEKATAKKKEAKEKEIQKEKDLKAKKE